MRIIQLCLLVLVVITTSSCWHPRVELGRTQGTGTFYVDSNNNRHDDTAGAQKSVDKKGRSRTCMEAASVFFVPQTSDPNFINLPADSPLRSGDSKPAFEDQHGAQIKYLGPTETIVRIINFKMYQTTQILLKNLTRNPGFKKVVVVCIALMVLFYSIGVIAGISQLNGFSIVAIAAKGIVISALALNYAFFSEVVMKFTEDIVFGLCTIMSNMFSAMPNVGDYSIFTPIDGTISMIFSTRFLKVLLGFILTGFQGLFFIIILLFVMFLYMIAAVKAVTVFITALVARFFLYFLAPIFLLFFFFKETKSLFDNWVKQLINFSLQPVFAFAYLGMMQLVFMAFLRSVMGNGHICYMKLFGIDFVVNSFYVYFWRFTTDLGRNATGGQYPDVQFNFLTMFTLIFITAMMIMMSKWVLEVSGRIAGSAIFLSNTPIFGAETLKNFAIRIPSNAALGGARGFFMGDGVARGGLFQGKNPFKGAAAGAKGAYTSTRNAIRREAVKNPTNLDVMG